MPDEPTSPAAAAPVTDEAAALAWWSQAPAWVKRTFSARPAATTTTEGPVTNAEPPVRNDAGGFMPFAAGEFRRGLLDLILDPRRQIDRECGYPADSQLGPELYLLLYRRVGLANRIVRLMPEESWRLPPVVYEVEDAAVKTPFESAIEQLWARLKVNFRLHQVDRVSGIGRFGVVFLGLDDGRDPSLPADGLDEGGRTTGAGAARILYLRVFNEAACKVQTRELDPTNPRFGLPKYYRITFDVTDVTGEAANAPTGLARMVHWSRVIHVAENRDQSEVFGTPRLESLVNPIADIRKILGGGAEMFWKGGFPGYAFKLAQGVGKGELDLASVRREIDEFQNGLQRFLGLVGIDVQSLTPQVASPREIYAVLIDYVCLVLGVPKRAFMGSEQAQLASEQDTKRWNQKIAKRNEEYVGPLIVREFVDRLIALGCLPAPEAEYFVWWPDLAITTEKEKAEVAQLRTACLAQYVQSGASEVIPPMQFLTEILDFEPDHAEAILKAAAERFEEQRELPHDAEEGEPNVAAPMSGVTPDPSRGAAIALDLEQDPRDLPVPVRDLESDPTLAPGSVAQ